MNSISGLDSIYQSSERDGGAYAPPQKLLKDVFVQNLNLIQFIQWLGATAQRLIKPLRSLKSTFKTQKRLYSLFLEKTTADFDTAFVFRGLGSIKRNIAPNYAIESTSKLQG